jgi:hypothetical protein
MRGKGLRPIDGEVVRWLLLAAVLFLTFLAWVVSQ